MRVRQGRQGDAVVVDAAALEAMIAHAYTAYPLEACGLLVGSEARIERFVPCANEAASARVYSIPARELLRAEVAAEADGLAIVGVMHSHTHTEPYPSPTDVAQAPDPTWHYVIVSLKRHSPETRSYRIGSGTEPGREIHETRMIVE
jgi:proteasome lid subunit RPN8/RPN11